MTPEQLARENIDRQLIQSRWQVQDYKKLNPSAAPGIAVREYPVSALGTPYPLNIKAVRTSLDKNGFKKIPISTNISEEQKVRSSSS